MTDQPLARPRQASMSGWFVLAGSVVVVLYSFQQVGYLGSIEAQEMAQDFVSTPPGDGLGISADDVQALLRVLNLVAGATATATAILGWQVLQRSRSARLALSLLAPVLLVSGLATAGLFATVVAAAVAMLWVQPTRAWFDGVAPPAPRPTPTPAPQRPDRTTAEPTTPAPPTGGSAWGLPAPGERATMAGMSDVPPPPPGSPQYPPVADARPRPAAVTRACITTIVVSGITFAGLLVSVIYLLTSRDSFVDQMRDELDRANYTEFSAETVADVALGFFVVVLVWTAVAVLLAVLTMRGSNGARITLAVSAIAAAVVSLVGALAIVPLAITVTAILSAVWLLSADAKAWTRR